MLASFWSGVAAAWIGLSTGRSEYPAGDFTQSHEGIRGTGCWVIAVKGGGRNWRHLIGRWVHIGGQSQIDSWQLMIRVPEVPHRVMITFEKKCENGKVVLKNSYNF